MKSGLTAVACVAMLAASAAACLADEASCTQQRTDAINARSTAWTNYNLVMPGIRNDALAAKAWADLTYMRPMWSAAQKNTYTTLKNAAAGAWATAEAADGDFNTRDTAIVYDFDGDNFGTGQYWFIRANWGTAESDFHSDQLSAEAMDSDVTTMNVKYNLAQTKWDAVYDFFINNP